MTRLALTSLEDRTPPAARLLADLNPFPGGDPRDFTVVGQTLFFTADDEEHGRELWKTDGTAAGTRLVKDLTPGRGDTTFSDLTPLNGVLYFSAGTFETGSELWKSDGTRAGTVRVRPADAAGPLHSPTELTRVGDVLYFRGTDDRGAELWQTDGTRKGTRLVKHLRPGPEGSEPHELTAVGRTLFFAAATPGRGFELWKSDGTAAGTVRVKDINPGPDGSSPGSFAARGNTLFFSAIGRGDDRELWKSDGTATGTVRVKDIFPGTFGSVPEQLTVVGDLVYFTAGTLAEGREVWRTNGTAAGTFRVADIRPGDIPSYPSSLTNVGGRLYFTATDGQSMQALYKVPGRGAAGATRIFDFGLEHQAFAGFLTPYGRKVAFAVQRPADPTNALWVSDGTPGGTVPITDVAAQPGGTDPADLTVFRNKLFFNGSDDLGRGLWKSNGTAAGTTLVNAFGPGSDGSEIHNPTAAGDSVFFFANDRLYKTDGTPGGTVAVAPAERDFPGATFERTQADVNGTLFFAAHVGPWGGPGTPIGVELWKSDGTVAGTVLVKDIWPGSPGDQSSSPQQLTNIDGTLYFSAAGTRGNRELWKSDGTEAGTVLVKDIDPSVNGESEPVGFTAVGGLVVFSAETAEYGRELWATDETEEGTVLLKDIREGPEWSGPTQFTPVGDILYFVAHGGPTGVEVWRTDGTPEGTMLVRDVIPSAFSGPQNLTAVGAVLYFTADDGEHGREVWKTDGTEEGTVLVSDLVFGPMGSRPENLTAYNGTLYFGAAVGTSQTTLWKLNEAGEPVQVRDLAGGPVGAPQGLTVTDGLLFMNGVVGDAGRELVVTDGTDALVVSDIYPGSDGSDPKGLTAVPGGGLFFTAQDITHGREPWAAEFPYAGLGGPASAVRSEPLAFNFAAFSPAGIATVTIDWGDGTTETFTGQSRFALEHTFTRLGTYTVRTTATDADGQVADAVETIVSVVATTSHDDEVVVGGTSQADVLVVRAGEAVGTIEVRLNGVSLGVFPTPTRVVFHSGAGTDRADNRVPEVTVVIPDQEGMAATAAKLTTSNLEPSGLVDVLGGEELM